ncbi:2-acylglycerol O-acyltransferase 2-A-like isoform X1 [Frieseomelitta varia]|uniref:2-acylglycerol O-acyltransferase 2-A-like isoform X1 n=1 Tax=Frieseomelitta varia TaxID=561572 RepID=UPI001CB67F7D|nr:2-acylglycerol O-acyltransferase 2-A-like isoform X1 [Frieseomelitta varia]
MEIFGVKFAPLNVPLKRRLETLSAAVCIVFFAFGNFCGYILTAYFLFFTETMRYFILLYFVWMYYDWNKTDVGCKRRKLLNWMRNCAWQRYFCSYFPIKLIKTVDLDPNKLYLFCNFPHGILSSGVYGAFGTDAAGCKELFPGIEIKVVILDQHFRAPFFREYCRINCVVSSTSESLNQQLSMEPAAPYTGRATVLIVGGAAEAMECKPGTYRILIKRRKGFVKLALKNGAPLVPVCSFGETNLFDQVSFPEGSFMNKLQNYIRKKIGIAPVIPIGRGFFQYTFGIIPRRTPITVVVGSPMELPKIEEPTVEQIDEYHGKFIEHVVDFFEKEKHKYVENADSVHLEFV